MTNEAALVDPVLVGARGVRRWVRGEWWECWTMNTLRDLDADRVYVRGCSEFKAGAPRLWEIADAALDEIDRLKRLSVWQDPETEMWGSPFDEESYLTADDAWAAVRKEAMK